MKFIELDGILCIQGVSLRMKGVVYKVCVCSMLLYGQRLRGVLEAASHREENA